MTYFLERNENCSDKWMSLEVGDWLYMTAMGNLDEEENGDNF